MPLKKLRWGLIAAGVLAVAIAGILGRGQWEQNGEPTPERVALGKRLYDENCAACHGAELEGEADWRTRKADGTLPAPPHDETGHTWHHPDTQLFVITKQGTEALAPAGYQTKMIGFGELLSDNEIRAVLDYIKSHWPDDIRARQAAVSEKAAVQ